MRLIDADALVTDYYDDYEMKDDEYSYPYVSRAQIDSAPSIDIVRCKECKYFKQGVRFNKPRNTDIENFCIYHMVFGWNANAFCSYGERIDDGNTV